MVPWLLLLWGGGTFLSYVGWHLLPLLPEDRAFAVARQVASPLVRGVLGLSALVSEPLTLIILGVTGGVLLLSHLCRAQLFHFRLALSPLHLLLVSLLLLWGIAHLVALTPLYGGSTFRLFPPTAEYYLTADADVLMALEENIGDLQRRGCLTPAPEDPRLFAYAPLCLELSLVKRVAPSLLFLLSLTLLCLAVGRTVCRWFLGSEESSLFVFFHLLVGTMVLLSALWGLALVGWAGARATIVLLALLAVGSLRSLRGVISGVWRVRLPLEGEAAPLTMLLGGVLLFLFAVNFLATIRPFPVGWDEIESYLNLPQEFSRLGIFVPGMQNPQWEHLTALPFLLFGSESVVAATVAMGINWWGGLLAVFGLLVAGQFLLGPRRGLLAAALFYSLPMVQHVSFADMKIENGLFAVMVGSVLAFLLSLEEGTTGRARWAGLGGLLAGLTLAMKPTSFLLLLFLGGIGGGTLLGGWGVAALSLLTVGGILALRPFALIPIFQPMVSSGLSDVSAIVISLTCILTATVLLVFRWGRDGDQREVHKLILWGCCGFLLATVPWMGRNVLRSTHLTPGTALWGEDYFRPQLGAWVQRGASPAPGVRGLPPSLAVDLSQEQCRDFPLGVDLDRFWGGWQGWVRWWQLPWRVVMNRDSQGYFVITSPLLLLAPFLFLLPRGAPRRWRLLVAGVAPAFFGWWLLGRGVPWYGIILFLPLVLLPEALLEMFPSKFTRGVITCLMVGSFLLALSLRLWQFRVHRATYEYAFGTVSARSAQELTFPGMTRIVRTTLERAAAFPSHPYVYRVGVPLGFFLPGDLWHVGKVDHELTFFSCLHQEGDDRRTRDRLLSLGFHAVLLDRGAASIEADSSGPLHRRLSEMLAFLSNPTLGLQQVVGQPEWPYVYTLLPVAPPESEGRVGG